MISLQGISKTYYTKNDQVTLFTGLDWKIEQGEFVALMGASGAGKSSILSLIAGIISPDEGSIYLGETDVTKLSTDQMIEYRGKNIAFIFQAFELIPNLTVEENIDLVLDISHADRRYSTSDILEKV
jgi:putative ABC transport system ATP-binding protein